MKNDNNNENNLQSQHGKIFPIKKYGVIKQGDFLGIKFTTAQGNIYVDIGSDECNIITDFDPEGCVNIDYYIGACVGKYNCATFTSVKTLLRGYFADKDDTD